MSSVHFDDDNLRLSDDYPDQRRWANQPPLIHNPMHFAPAPTSPHVGPSGSMSYPVASAVHASPAESSQAAAVRRRSSKGAFALTNALCILSLTFCEIMVPLLPRPPLEIFILPAESTLDLDRLWLPLNCLVGPCCYSLPCRCQLAIIAAKQNVSASPVSNKGTDVVIASYWVLVCVGLHLYICDAC